MLHLIESCQRTPTPTTAACHWLIVTIRLGKIDYRRLNGFLQQQQQQRIVVVVVATQIFGNSD